MAERSIGPPVVEECDPDPVTIKHGIRQLHDDECDDEVEEVVVVVAAADRVAVERVERTYGQVRR